MKEIWMGEQGKDETKSYKQIFKSSFLIGGSQIINIIVNILKNKVVAIILGPAGVGVMGIYMAFVGVFTPIANLGIGTSGVRQISEAINEKNEDRKGYIIRSIRRILLAASILIAVIILILRENIAELSFGKEIKPQYVVGVGVLSLMIIFETLTSGERAILQGTRELKSLAKAQIVGAIVGAIMSVLVVYYFRETGIAIFLVISSLVLYVIFRFYSRSITISGILQDVQMRKQETRMLLSLGLAFVITVVVGSIVNYILRMIVLDGEGIIGVGIYQAAWGLVNMGFNVVLISMGTDFYPRLVAVSNNTAEVNRTVNQQVEVSLLFALPVLLGLYVFSPVFLEVFFSSEFLSGVQLSRWLAISCFFKVLCWPLAYITIANGNKKLFVISSLLWEVIHIPIIILCINLWGLEGIGISYVVDYIIVLLGATYISKRFFTFSWSKKAITATCISFIFIICLVTLNQFNPPSAVFYSIGVFFLVLSIVRSAIVSQRILGFKVLNAIKRS